MDRFPSRRTPLSHTLHAAVVAGCLSTSLSYAAVPEQPGKPKLEIVEEEVLPPMVEVVVPGLVSTEDAERVRERSTINPTTAEFKKAQEQSLTPDATGAVRAPVFRSLKQAHAAGVNPEPVPIPAASPLNATVERPLWAIIAGWTVAGLVAVGVLLTAAMGIRRWVRGRNAADPSNDD